MTIVTILDEIDGRRECGVYGGLEMEFVTRVHRNRDDAPVVLPESIRHSRDVEDLWRFAEKAELFVDETYGQNGLILHSREDATSLTEKRVRAGYEIDPRSELVIGEFIGDSDMLVVSDPPEDGASVCHVGSGPREEWERFPSLEEFIRRYVDSSGEKFWES